MDVYRKELLLCGGAAGHLQHLYDNPDLTFGELKDVLSSAAEGKLEKVSEKLDGMNIVFTFVPAEGLKVARTGSDIKNGGMDAEGLAKKFFGRGNIEEAFNNAFKVLNQALGSLSKNDVASIFANGARWYSMEIVYASEPNTINYDSNNIVFHGWPIFEMKKDGSVEQSDDDSGVTLLTKRINQMQKAITMKDWNVRGPSLLRLKQISDGSVLQKALASINSAMQSAGVSDSNTVYDYLRNLLIDNVKQLGLPPKAAKMTVERCAQVPGAPSVNDIKKETPKEKQAAVQTFIRESEMLLAKYMLPVEKAIQDFAVEVLRGIHSTLIAKSDEEVARLRSQLSKAINAIEKSGNQAAMDVLQKEMSRLGSIDNVGAAMEGIVFFYKGQAYKFTGAFAPAHQIMALFKYGRKGIPKMDIGEADLKNVLKKLLNEGGHAFKDVGSIPLEDFKKEWPRIKNDLDDLGVEDVEWIGSTGKKQLMGDVDLAGRFDGERDELFSLAGDVLGHGNVTKVGSNIISIRYERESGEPFQVDLMLGDPKYLRWSRYGTSPEKGHKDYSVAKGAVRNVLLNTVNSFVSSKVFPGKQTELDRTRYTVDFDKGLFKVTQTKRNKMPGKPPTKDWKTVERELVTSDPDELVQIVFGKEYTSNDLRSFEDVVRAIKTSKKLKGMARSILTQFATDMKDVASRNPSMMGQSPEETLMYIDKVAHQTI